MHRTAVINVVGLTPALIGPRTPRIGAFLRSGKMASVRPAFPAVTCTAQSNYITGVAPSEHGIVGNGWYDRDLAEVQFWKQSNRLVGAPKLWDDLRGLDPTFTCAKLFWWYNMYARVEYSITPRPIYCADGRKVFDIYAAPGGLRPEIKRDLGDFPFPTFWGPAAGVDTPQGDAAASSRWIARSAMWIEERHRPTLSLVYLPHLDYNLQRRGVSAPANAKDLEAIDSIVGDLIDFFSSQRVQVVLLSEYGIVDVQRPIHLNRVLREHGWIAIRDELGLELLDCGASKAFAVADHQVAHVYVRDKSLVSDVRAALEACDGVDAVLERDALARAGLAHARAGDLVVVAKPDAWFTYYYWFEDSAAPDFARTVDIHRKPGYDPVELFLDPAMPAVKAGILWRLLKKKLGFRMLMDVIPLDASLVRGSHGRATISPADSPVLITQRSDLMDAGPLESTEVYFVLRRHVTG